MGADETLGAGRGASGPVPPVPGHTDCSEALLRAYEFLDGELAPGDCARIQAHLEECRQCLQQYELDITLKALIKRSCRHEHAPDTLRMTIMSRISMTVTRLEEF
ncbi:MAG: mycothiol system anti-sigma-R factor [Micrococcales bacterium]|nr:mycothiol system anti-sigma-R factor [Micrococcales bacterium]